MISARHLYKKYGKRTVVSDVTLHVKKGEVLGFIGPNGAGKSTTIKILSGVLPVYDGAVEIGGFDLTEQPQKAKSLVGYLPENAPLPPNMTVRAFLDYVAAMRGIRGAERANAIAGAVSRCALTEVLNEEIESLSKGYKRRVCFAQAIIHDPAVLMMDEPTDGLDPNQKREIRNLIQLLRRDTAVIISTHILEEVRSVCSRVLLLAGGKTVFDGPTEEFTALERAASGCAFEFERNVLPEVAALMRSHFPGVGRLDGNRFIVPAGHREMDGIRKLLSDNGICVLAEQEVPATLDDVFAALTASAAEQTADAAVPPPADAPAASPAAGTEGADDDDD